MAFNEKGAAEKLLVQMGFTPEIAALVNSECDLTVAVFARNGQGTIEKNKQLMAAAAEMKLGYRAVSGDGLFVYFPKPKTVATKAPSEMEQQMAKLKAERDALQAKLAAMEKTAPPSSQEEPVQPVQPSRPARTRPAPPPIDDHFGDM